MCIHNFTLYVGFFRLYFLLALPFLVLFLCIYDKQIYFLS